MSRLPGLQALAEELTAEKLRHLLVRGFVVIDENALAVASTLHNPVFEQQVCGLGGKALQFLKQAQKDLDLSQCLYVWLAGVERNLAVIPVAENLYLVAVCDAAASPATALVPLLSFSQRLTLRVLQSDLGSKP
ncbi:MAG: hypothetical protein ACK42L_10755 [Thermoanaerobaculum sp.]